MTVKEGGWAQGEDEDRMSCSADSRHGYPKRGRAAWRGLRTVPEVGKWVAIKREPQSLPFGLRPDPSIFWLC